jgi:hypothetical protein
VKHYRGYARLVRALRIDQLQDVVRGVKPKFSSQDINTMGEKFLSFIEKYAEQ